MKIACIYHSVDLDGWMSAAIVKHWWKLNNATENGQIVKDFSFKDEEQDILISPFNTLTFIGYNYGQSIPDLSEYDKVIMCDISFPVESMRKLCMSTYLIWIDHHISSISEIYNLIKTGIRLDGLTDVSFSACELTWQYLFPDEPMPEIVRLLGRYDCFGHKGTSEEEYVLEFQYGARQCINDYQLAYLYLQKSIMHHRGFNKPTVLSPEEEIYNRGAAIYAYLRREAKQIYNRKFDLGIIVDETYPNGNTKGIRTIRRFAAINHERFNPINFGIDYHADGYDGVASFWIDENIVKFSLYNDNGLVDCSEIAKRLGGGVHKGASEFIISNDSLPLAEILKEKIVRMYNGS